MNLTYNIIIFFIFILRIIFYFDTFFVETKFEQNLFYLKYNSACSYLFSRYIIIIAYFL